MYRYYVASMQEHGAAKATVYNFVVTSLGSYLWGYLVFNEEINSRLMCGVSLIIFGTAIIASSGAKPDEAKRLKVD